METEGLEGGHCEFVMKKSGESGVEDDEEEGEQRIMFMNLEFMAMRVWKVEGGGGFLLVYEASG